MRIMVGVSILSLASTCLAQAPTMRMDCGQIPGYRPEVERQFLSRASGGGDIYNINVTFITKRPDDKLVDKALRDCIATSLKLDDKKGILATGWFRPVAGANPYDDEILRPYGGLRFISYSPKTKSVTVEDLTLNIRK